MPPFSPTPLPPRLFVTGIGTDIGKTTVCAALVRDAGYAYIKPLQAGEPADTDTVASIAGPQAHILPTPITLAMPASPHQAAAAEDRHITAKQIADAMPNPLPERILIEGAGGLLVPLNDTETMADLALLLGLPLLLVVRFYLGSINHTLLTLEAAQSRGLNVAALACAGEVNAASLQAIQARFDIGLVHVPVF